MTCECGHIKAEHEFTALRIPSPCFKCGCPKYRRQTENESTPDEAYLDRNLAVQVMAKMAQELHYRVGVKDEKTDWPILYVDLPTGQVSWHIPKKELMGDLPIYEGKWDGHDLETKRNRLKAYIEALK